MQLLAHAFEAGAGDSLTYAEQIILSAYDAIGSSISGASWESHARSHIARAATLATLIESEGEDKLNRVLTDGWANFGPEAAEEILRFWVALANQKGEDVPLASVDRESIDSWVKASFAASKEAEGSNAPNAWARQPADEWDLALSWQGTWTQKRYFTAKFCFDEDGTVRVKETFGRLFLMYGGSTTS